MASQTGSNYRLQANFLRDLSTIPATDRPAALEQFKSGLSSSSFQALVDHLPEEAFASPDGDPHGGGIKTGRTMEDLLLATHDFHSKMLETVTHLSSGSKAEAGHMDSVTEHFHAISRETGKIILRNRLFADDPHTPKTG